MQIERPKPKITLPPSAKLAFKGQTYDVYQWPQELYDGTVKTFEILKRADSVNVIAVTPDKKIIISHEEQPARAPYTATPGGVVDSGEDPLVAAKRELLEEAGYASEDWTLFYALQPFSRIDCVSYAFVARNCKKVSEQKLDAGEKISIEFADLDKFIDTVCGDGFRDFELRLKIMQTRLQPEKFEEFKKLIFG